jgi:hypothetical protein
VQSTPYHLSLTGILTIRTIEDTCSCLRDALAQHDAIVVDCGGAEEVDLSLIQLLLAAQRSAGSLMRLAMPLPEVLQQALRRAGLPDQSQVAHRLFEPTEDVL